MILMKIISLILLIRGICKIKLNMESYPPVRFSFGYRYIETTYEVTRKLICTVYKVGHNLKPEVHYGYERWLNLFTMNNNQCIQ